MIAAVATACAIFPPVSATVYDIGVNFIGLNVVNGITALLTGLLLWGSANLGQAAAVILGIYIFGAVMWILLLRKVSKKPTEIITTKILGKQVAPVAREEPRDIIMTENATATKKQEVAPVE